MEDEQYIESGLSVGAVKYVDPNEIITEEQFDYINNKVPELDGRVGVIEDEIEEINSSLDNIMNNSITLNNEYKGINIVNDTLDLNKYQTEFDRLKENGFDTLFINEMSMMDSTTSTDINYSEYYSILNNIVDLGLSKGFKIFLKPMLNLSVGWRGTIEPSDVTTFFNNYETWLNSFVNICTLKNLDGLIIGTELRALTKEKYKKYWVNIIDNIRNKYSGILSYACNFHTYETDEICSFSFYEKLDMLGFNIWGEYTNEVEPSVDKLITSWGNDKNNRGITSYLKNLSKKYNKQVLITEIGIRSKKGANINTGFYDDANIETSEIEQANWYKSFFMSLAQNEIIDGFAFWCRNVNYTNTYDFKNKQAEIVISEVLKNE